jgi:MerR family transcriptional regulator, heat shock protein HspR
VSAQENNPMNRDPVQRDPMRRDPMRRDPMNRAVYVISVAAELAGVHPQTLRVYERRGLVDPSRTGGGSRRYSDRDLERLRRIQDLTAEGLNLEGVRKVLVLEAEVERLSLELQQVKAEAREALEKTHRHYRRDLVPLRQLPMPGGRIPGFPGSPGSARSGRNAGGRNGDSAASRGQTSSGQRR